MQIIMADSCCRCLHDLGAPVLTWTADSTHRLANVKVERVATRSALPKRTVRRESGNSFEFLVLQTILQTHSSPSRQACRCLDAKNMYVCSCLTFFGRTWLGKTRLRPDTKGQSTRFWSKMAGKKIACGHKQRNYSRQYK